MKYGSYDATPILGPFDKDALISILVGEVFTLLVVIVYAKLTGGL